MGFYLNLLVTLPNKRTFSETESVDSKTKTITLWDITGVVAIDRVTRLEKITAKRFSHIHFGGKSRAAICVVDCFFRPLAKVLNNPTKSNFAPPFAVAEFYDMTAGTSVLKVQNSYTDMSYESVVDGESKVIPLHSFERMIPREDMLIEHNRVLSLSEHQVKEFCSSEEYRIFDSGPFLWQPASVVSGWMENMPTLAPEAWVEIKKDVVSMAYYNAWKTHLQSMGAIGANVIFAFVMMQIPDLV